MENRRYSGVSSEEEPMKGEIEFCEKQHHWTCETCGFITDTSLTISMNGSYIGAFYEDTHLGTSSIDKNEVERAVVTALQLPLADYHSMVGIRSMLEEQRDGYRSNESVNENTAMLLDEQIKGLFFNYLETQGYTVKMTTVDEEDPLAELGE